MSTAKKAAKKQDEIEEQQQPALRRSSRATRGSIKPVIDLTKEAEEDDEPVKDEDDDYRGDDDEKVKSKRSSRKSSLKPVAPKKTSAKGERGATKKSVSKQECKTAKTKVKEEVNQDDGCDDRDKSGGEKEQTSPCDDGGNAQGDKDDEDMEDDLFYDLSEKEMKEINNAFDLNKLSDEDELLTADGIKTAMRSLGFEPRGDEVKRMVKKFASKSTGKVNRHGFQSIMAYKYGTTPAMRNDRSKDEISRVFNLLDLDKTGLITLENLRSIAKELNEDLADEDLLEMIEEADQNGDMMINKDEFHNIMKKTSLY